MQIDHIALYTRDLERLCEFYTKYFDGTAGKLYQNEETGTQACFVSFADGARLEIVTRPQFEDAEHSRLWTGWAHTSFKAGTRERRTPSRCAGGLRDHGWPCRRQGWLLRQF
ncbi:MAG: VOC family protein [Acutalibacteraceae bacterium]